MTTTESTFKTRLARFRAKQEILGAYEIDHPIVFWSEVNRDQNPICSGDRVKMPQGTIVSVLARGLQSAERVLCMALDNTRMVYAWADFSELKRVL